MEQSYGYSNGVSYNLIVKKLLEDRTPPYKKKLYISQGIKYITDTDLLNKIILQLAQNNLIDYEDDVVLKFRKELVERNYSEDVNTKLRTDFLSMFLDYDAKANYFQNVTKEDRPKLNVKVRRKQLFHNYNDVSKYIKTQMAFFQEKEISKLPPERQEDAYKKLIKETTLFHFGKDFKEFKEELELFKTLKENIFSNSNQQRKAKTNPELEHPFIVLNAKELFLEYISKHIIEPHLDYSYLFQRLLKEKFIYKITHFQFMDWLEEKNYITEKTKDKFLKKGVFYSLDKSSTSHRENNFNNVFKPLLQSS